MIYWELFYTFFLIGMFTFGGGYAMLSLIQNRVVEVHQWIDASTFTDIIAISQMTPGPIGINSATYIGYSVTGDVFGSLIATIAVVLPSFIVVLAIAILFAKFKDNRWASMVIKELRPAIIGMIGAAALLMITPSNFPDYTGWIIFGTAFIVSMWGKINPIYILLASGLAGWIIY